MSAPAKYSSVAIYLHWIVGALILYNAFFPPELDDVPREAVPEMMQLHMGIGLLVLIGMLARLAWRLTHPVPALPADMPDWQKIASKITQWGLYAVVLAMACLGLLTAMFATWEASAFGFIPLSGIVTANHDTHEFFYDLHHALNKPLIGLFVLHTAAALYHRFFKRDGVMESMLPW